MHVINFGLPLIPMKIFKIFLKIESEYKYILREKKKESRDQHICHLNGKCFTYIVKYKNIFDKVLKQISHIWTLCKSKTLRMLVSIFILCIYVTGASIHQPLLNVIHKNFNQHFCSPLPLFFEIWHTQSLYQSTSLSVSEWVYVFGCSLIPPERLDRFG